MSYPTAAETETADAAYLRTQPRWTLMELKVMDSSGEKNFLKSLSQCREMCHFSEADLRMSRRWGADV